jgi:hypothetical protein
VRDVLPWCHPYQAWTHAILLTLCHLLQLQRFDSDNHIMQSACAIASMQGHSIRIILHRGWILVQTTTCGRAC